jgi:hypothetical protein
MTSLHRMPPVLRGVWALGMLTILASLGVNTWAWLVGRESGGPREHIYFIGWALLELGLVYNWMVVAYNVRHPARLGPGRHAARAAPWLDAGRGQLLTACIGGALPVATIVALVVAPVSPLIFLAFPVNVVFLVGWYGVLGWAMWPAERRH